MSSHQILQRVQSSSARSLSQEEQERWSESKLRWNILQGIWEWEVLIRMREQYGLQMISNMGRPATSINLLANSVSQTAVLHDQPALWSNDSLRTPEVWAQIVQSTHLASILQELCQKTVAVREVIPFVSTSEILGDATLSIEIVPSHEIVIDKTTEDQSTPLRIRRQRTFTLREGATRRDVDCWEIWDISDPMAPVHEVLDGEGMSRTASVYPEEQGYPFIDEEGPFLPCVLYRAKYNGRTWDPYYGAEVVAGTLDIAIHWTMWGLCLRNNSWPQWWFMDCEVPGMTSPETTFSQIGGGAGAPETAEIGPNIAINLKSDANQKGNLGQLTPADVKAMAESILMKQNTILNNIGIHPDDISASASAQSGVAIQLKRSAQRRIAMSYAPAFRQNDTKLVSLLCRMSNLFHETDLPTAGWDVQYQLPEMSADEFLQDLEKDKELVKLGLMSAVQLVQKLYSLDTPEQAVSKMEEIRRHNLRFPITF